MNDDAKTPDKYSDERRIAQAQLDEIKRCETLHYYNPNKALKPVMEAFLALSSAGGTRAPIPDAVAFNIWWDRQVEDGVFVKHADKSLAWKAWQEAAALATPSATRLRTLPPDDKTGDPDPIA